MIEVYNVWMELPWKVQLLCLTPLCVLPMLWYLSPKRLHPWMYRWERHIDNEIAYTRKTFKGKVRTEAYRDAFARLIHELERETGGCNFVLMHNVEHRLVWMYLYRKIHYTL